MGIRNLNRFLEAHNALPSITELPAGSCLLVDGPGFLFYLCALHVSFEDKVFGGDYSRLSRAVEREVSWLRNDLGLELIVFFDGPRTSEFKLDTSDKRWNRREEEWTNWSSFCRFPTTNMHSASAHFALPQIPQLAWVQFSHTLARLGIEQVNSEGEADLEIAFRIQLFNAESREYFCYGRDSDYVAMRNCPYIEFGSLKIKDEGGVFAPVFDRKEICTKLQLTQTAFVDVCIMLGNDVIPEGVQFNCTESASMGYNRAVDLYQLLISGEEVVLPLTSPTHQAAIDYCRLFYNVDSHATLQRICGTDKPRQVLEEKFLSEEEALWTDSKSNNFVEFWSLLRQVQLKQKSSPSFFSGIQVLHLYALSQMHSTINGNVPMLSNELAVTTPNWEDVVAGQVWQTICKRFYRLNRLQLEPYQVFHGKLFHHFVDLVRQQESPPIPSAVSGGGKYMTLATLTPKPAPSPSARPKVSNPDEMLPIDAKREEILRTVRDNQVTLICGETGCGKSTKVCLFLTQQARQAKVKILVSQPTRIAVQSLMNRMRKTLGRRVGMRMGHGTVDEFPETDVWFVTTGYLVQRLAALRNFDEFSHIIIDEMHERSTQADLAVLLAKKLVTEHASSTKLVLMSATANINLYYDYFAEAGLSVANLFVGAKRFENQIYHVDEVNLPQHLVGNLSHTLSLSSNTSKDQCKLVVHLVRNGNIPLGSGVLVFVSGLADIEHLHELLEPFTPKIVLFAIHSQLNEEFNEALFQPCRADQVKVIVATNAAQSSITIPDVDVVIDLGTHKTMQYNQKSHTSALVEQWISQSSAVQRAGRTGRVKPGIVYRLYSSKVFETEFSEHDTAEILESPLDDTILSLRSTFEHLDSFLGVIPILDDMLEAPDLGCIQNSFLSLYRQQMISEPNDFGMLTTCGRFVSKLGIGASMGRLVALGVCFGVGMEMTVIASALSQPKSLFKMTHPLMHSPEENYEILRDNLMSVLQLDCGYLSEPIMMLQIFKLFRQPTAGNATGGAMDKLTKAFSLTYDRVKGFLRATDRLLTVVGKLIQNNEFDTVGEFALSEEKLVRIRLLLTWTSCGRLMSLNIPKKNEMMVAEVNTSAVVGGKLPVTTWFQVNTRTMGNNEGVEDENERWDFALPTRIWVGKRGMIPPVSLEAVGLQIHSALHCPVLVLTDSELACVPGNFGLLPTVFGAQAGMLDERLEGVFSCALHAVNDLQHVLTTFIAQFGWTSNVHGAQSCVVLHLEKNGKQKMSLYNLPTPDAAIELKLQEVLWGPTAQVNKEQATQSGTLRFRSKSLTAQLLKTYLKKGGLRVTNDSPSSLSSSMRSQDVANVPIKVTFPQWKTLAMCMDRSVLRLEEDDEYWSDEFEEDDGGGLITMGRSLIVSKPTMASAYMVAGKSYAVVSRSMEIGSGDVTMPKASSVRTVAELVTIIPNAESFLPLAFACVQWTPVNSSFRKLLAWEDEACARMRDELKMVLCDESTIAPHNMLWDLVDEIFPLADATESSEKCAQLEQQVAKLVAFQRTPKKTPSKSTGGTPKPLKTPVTASKSQTPITASKSQTPITAPKSQTPVTAPKSKTPVPTPKSKTPVSTPKSKTKKADVEDLAQMLRRVL
ncbi:hypothetical protein BASA81_009077 [Batrachochytrium salamandrivorans]|nr:hypothetical protein BASA81_009077 [Batrachochytrium salamandrivorans]